MSHLRHAANLKNEVIELLLNRMGADFCPPCAAQALINALSEVMSSAIRTGDPNLSKQMATEVAGHLETMAALYRQHQPTEPDRSQARKH